MHSIDLRKFCSRCYCLQAEYEKKALREMQTLHAGCSNTDPKIFAPPQTPFPGVRDGQNLISWDMVTTFTYRPSLVKIDARNFELSW